ncbi:MAG TPA: hypothetical protein VH329_01245 [Solirubrobacterales bacterium]
MTGQETTAPTEQAAPPTADACPECGSGLAADQRYCLNCGWRRGGARVDYESQILRSGPPAPAGAPVATAPAGGGQQWSPLLAIGAIALLGVFLLLGVLIGKKDNNTTQTVQAQAAPTTTSAAAAPPPTTASATPDKSAKGGGNKAAAAGAGTAPGQGNVVQGGSGNTEGIQQANTNASPQENAKNGADVVATGGAPEKLDPNGQAGGGSGATCIGC